MTFILSSTSTSIDQTVKIKSKLFSSAVTFDFVLFQSVTKMIQEACTYVDKTPNLDTKLKLIDTLRTVTAGKVCLIIDYPWGN